LLKAQCERQLTFARRKQILMKKILSTRTAPWALNLSLFILRVGLGLLMIPHGYNKMIHFSERSSNFMDFLGMGSAFSLALVIFAEFFCALFVAIGLFTRITVVPLVITMAVAVFKAHDADIFGDGERGMLFLMAAVVIMLTGPGKASVDGIMGK
jgi:putative oxidoreductase